jgi:hypothetical protein
MTIGWRTPGAWASGSTSVAPALPASPAAGDRMILFVGAKPYTATIADVSNWTRIGTQQTNGTTANATDAGSVTWSVFYRDWQSGDAAPTVTVTGGNVALAVIHGATKTAASWDTVTAYFGSDTSSGTGYSITAASSSGNIASGDGLIHATVIAGNNATFATPTITATSATIGTVTESPATEGTTATGFDLEASSASALVTAGTSSADAVAGWTLSIAQTGGSALVRLRENLNTTLTPTVADDSLDLTGVAPVVVVNSTITPAAGALAIGYAANVKFLAHFDGADGATSTTDSSPTPKTITLSGTAALDTGASKFGGSSLQVFSGTGNGAAVTSHADLEFGTGDFTIDFWYNSVDTTTHGAILTVDTAHTNQGFFSILANGAFTDTGALDIYANNNQGFSDYKVLSTTGANVTDGNWHLISIERDGTAFTAFVDGVVRGTATVGESQPFGRSGCGLRLNSQVGFSRENNAWYDDALISNHARYGGIGFTPPTTPFSTGDSPRVTQDTPITPGTGSLTLDGDPYFSSVVLLLHGDGANNGSVITDSSSSAKAYSANSGPVTTQTGVKKYGTASLPFGGNYLQYAAHADWQFGTGDFTIEAWVYSTFWDTEDVIASTYQGGANGWLLMFTTSGTKLQVRDGDTTVVEQAISGGAPATSTWHHVAASRVSGVVHFFLNGVEQGTGSAFTSNLSYNGLLEIGSYTPGGHGGTLGGGYLDDLRITKSVGRYTANFTAPTAAFPDFAGGPSAPIVTVQASTTGELVLTGVAPAVTQQTTITPAAGALTIADTYATWDPATSYSSITLSNGNLTTDGTSTFGFARATVGKSSGKWYWEQQGSGFRYETVIGVAPSTGGNDHELTTSTGEVGYQSGGRITYPGSFDDTGVTYTTETIGVRLDMDAGTISFYKNNSLAGSKSGLTGAKYPAIGAYSLSGPQPSMTANFGASAFTYAVPAGYNAGVYSENAQRPTVVQATIITPATGALRLSSDFPLDTTDLQGQYVYGNGITEVSGGVSQWDDLHSTGHHLQAASAPGRPTKQANGSIRFDGLGNYLQALFSLEPPVTVYLRFVELLSSSGRAIFDGGANNKMQAFQSGSPNYFIEVFNGIAGTFLTGIQGAFSGGSATVKTLTLVVNGASSGYQLDEGTFITGDAGAIAGLAGFTLGSNGSGGSFSNIDAYVALVYDGAHDATQRSTTRQYVSTAIGAAYGIAPTVAVSQTITPTAGALALAGDAPAVSIPIVIAPSAGALALTGVAPAVTRQDTITPVVGALALTGIAPSVTRQDTLTPAVGGLALTGIAPVVTRQDTLAPTAGALTLTGAAPAIASAGAATPSTGDLALNGIAPAVTLQALIVPAVGALALTGAAPAVTQQLAITPAVGALALTGVAPAVTRQDTLTPTAGTLTLAGAAPSIARADTIAPTAGVLVLTGAAPTVTSQDAIAPSAGSMVLTGVAPDVSYGIVITPTAGDLTLTGVAPTLEDTLTPAAGELAFTGLNASVDGQLACFPLAGALSLTGVAPSSVLNENITPAAAAELSLTGAAPTVLVVPGAGSLDMTGAAPEIVRGWWHVPRLPVGGLSLTGIAPSVIHRVTVTPDTAALTTGAAAPLVTRQDQIAPSSGELAATGAVSLATRQDTITPAVGALSLAGIAPSVTRQNTITPTAGALNLIGSTPQQAALIVPATAALALTGAEPGFGPTVSITPDVGAITFAGQLTELVREDTLTPAAASLVFDSQSPVLSLAEVIPPTDPDISLFVAHPDEALYATRMDDALFATDPTYDLRLYSTQLTD